MVNSYPSSKLPASLSTKHNQLIELFKKLKRVLVAYSGGVDSALLLKIGTDALGKNCVGVLGVSASLAEDEKEIAVDLARGIEAHLELLPTFEMENELYIKNDIQRCFHCKHELFSRMRELAREKKFDFIVDGSNADDQGDYRPGMEAAMKLDVRSPFLEVNMNKEEIRLLARQLGLPIWDKPAQPCLSSRVMYGQSINRTVLSMIDKAEQFIKQRGYPVVRVRHLGSKASVEVEASQLERILQKKESDLICSKLRDMGFTEVVIDPDGYRQGSLNKKHATG